MNVKHLGSRSGFSCFSRPGVLVETVWKDISTLEGSQDGISKLYCKIVYDESSINSASGSEFDFKCNKIMSTI